MIPELVQGVISTLKSIPKCDTNNVVCGSNSYYETPKQHIAVG